MWEISQKSDNKNSPKYSHDEDYVHIRIARAYIQKVAKSLSAKVGKQNVCLTNIAFVRLHLGVL